MQVLLRAMGSNMFKMGNRSQEQMILQMSLVFFLFSEIMILAGWCFGTFVIFPYILGISSFQLTFIFFRGWLNHQPVMIFEDLMFLRGCTDAQAWFMDVHGSLQLRYSLINMAHQEPLEFLQYREFALSGHSLFHFTCLG